MTEKSLVLDSPGQLLHGVAVANNVTQQKDNLTFDLGDGDLCDASLASSSDNVSKHQLGVNSLGESHGRQSLSETSQDQATLDCINTQEVKVAVKQWTDANNDVTQLSAYEKLIKEESDFSIVQTGLPELHSIDQDATLKNDTDVLALGCSSEYPESAILLDSCCHGVSGSDSFHNDALSSILHDRYSAEVDTSANKMPEVDLAWHTSSDSVIKDPEVQSTMSSVACENSRFADIPDESRNQRVKLTLDGAEMDAVCSSAEQTAQDRLTSMFSCILDKSEYFSKEFPSAAEMQQISHCLNAGIYASFGGMELRDDMELIAVDDRKIDGEHAMDGKETVCNTNDYLNHIRNLTSFSNDTCLGGMELHEDMVLIPVDDGNSGSEHDREVTETICDTNNYSDSLGNDIDSHTHSYENERVEFSQLTSGSLQMYQTESASCNEEQLETEPRDDGGIEVAQHSVGTRGNYDALNMDDNHGLQPSDSGMRLLLTQQHASISDQTLECVNTAHNDGQDMLECDLALTSTGKVCDSSNENSESRDTADDIIGRSSSALVSASGNVQSVMEMEHVDTLVSLETIQTDTDSTGLPKVMDSTVSSHAPEMVDSYLNETNNLKLENNEEHENSTDGAAATCTAHFTCADVSFLLDAGLSENSVMECHPDLPLLTNEETLSTVCYANEDSSFSVYEQSGEQLELFTTDDTSLQTQRLELDDLTLTVTCFIPEENEELMLDEDTLGDMSPSEHLEVPSLSSIRKPPDPVILTDLAHYIDHSIVSADVILPKRRSSDFMLSYLMPIDETAEFTDDANANMNYSIPDESHVLEPDYSLDDMKTEPSNNDKHKMAYNIYASSTVEHALHVGQELVEKVQRDVAATTGIEESRLGGSLPNVHNIAVTPVFDNGCKPKSSDDKQQTICEENYISLENPVERTNGNISERHKPTQWFSADWQDTVDQVVGVNKYPSNGSVEIAACYSKAATDVTQVSQLLDDNNEYARTAEHTTLTTDLPSQACSEDHTQNGNDKFMLLAAETTHQPSHTYPDAKPAMSNAYCLGDEYFLDTNPFKQKTLEGIDDAVEQWDDKCKNSKNDKTETFANDETQLSENSAVRHTAELKCNNELCVETSLQLCERPVLQSNEIQAVLDALLQRLVHRVDTQQTTVEEHPLSHIARNDRDASHSFAPVLRNSSPVIVKTPMEIEEPATDALTDFESTLEQLHSTQYTAHTD